MGVAANDPHAFGQLSKLVQPTRILVAAGGFLVIYCLLQALQIIYNTFFHPLRRYPGPKLAAVTKLPYQRSRISGNQVAWITSLHSRYGDVVRVAPNELSYIDGQAWKDIYGFQKAGKGENPKDTSFYGIEAHGSQSIITMNEQDHGRVRRIFSAAFSNKALKQQEPLFLTYVDLLIEKLHEIADNNTDAEVNLVDFYNFTTFDVMGDLTFGEPLYMLKDTKYSPWVSAIFAGIKLGTMFHVIGSFPTAKFLLERLAPRSLKEKRRAHSQYTNDRVDRRLKKETSRPDIWSLVLSQSGDKCLSVGEMHSNANIFMIAGTETTATLLSGLTFYLLKTPATMDRLVNEIRSAFADTKEITMERLAQLKYLNACVEEGLRMYPPVPIGLPRVTPPEGTEICGRFVAGGTSVYVSQFAAYRNPKNFHSPDSFIPERWLGEDEESSEDNKQVLQPFSLGPRGCLGKNMAYHEIRLILAKVLWHFDLVLCSQSERWADQKVYSLWEKQPLMCRLTPKREV
ncbi:hypothetical protein W97_00741 [Coniosporium apollinis CBS 100218]|uniref:Cytochrome P450 monooxygenase n=1 Tax=Coniosporium apollinis (strain CBS 100218) TaxID=1168221 RepID=R7YIS0_CONA1|nr:uncharacterized protein W97_00741 [Coniosporium apollinis CBS 100218]EON61526.1 hypothetical protein W97_00741 [Coniosporium apollinis CBS 100218]